MTEPAAQALEQVRSVASAYRLTLAGARSRGRVGHRRGAGPGSSLELHDFREYAPGDDLRHVDWASYARTDQLRVRLHEAEVAPVVEVLLDTSRSMASTPQKEASLRELAAAFALWARADGSTAKAWALGGGAVELAQLSCDGDPSPAPPRAALRPGSVRVLLTDGLWEQDPGALLRVVAAGASRWALVQLLDPSERAPEIDRARTYVDCETGRRATLRLDERARSVYLERLERLCSGLRERALRLSGDYVAATAAPLEALCKRDLLAAGVVEPR